MSIKQPTDFFRLFLYLLFGAAFLFLAQVGNNGEPLGLALLYALPVAGLSPVVSGALYVVSAIPYGLHLTLWYLLQAVLLAIGFLIQNKFLREKHTRWFLSMLCLSLSLGAFVAFVPFTSYSLPFSLPFTIDGVVQKTVVAALVFLLSAVFSVAIKSMLHKFLKCRLREDELVFCIVFFLLVGVGICKFLSVNAYLGIAFFVLLVFARVTGDSTAMICAFVLALPPAIVAKLSPERFFFYGAAVVLFMKSGKLAAALSVLAVFFAYGYFDGLYAYPTPRLVAAVLSAVLPTLLFILLPTSLIKELENKLIFYREKHLSRIAINRNRMAIGEKLYEISSVFREIESTFSALSTTQAEDGAKEYIRGCVLEETCKTCPQHRACARKNTPEELNKLIDVGCLKGRVSLIDMPQQLAGMCVNQSAILQAVNRQIGDYKKYMTETENAASGRTLLANQAQGVSEVLKNLAVEQSEPIRIYTEKEKALNVALLGVGIVCSEVLIFGDEENLTLSLITFGKADVKKIAAVATHLFSTQMIISERIALSKNKFCCILRKKPCFDAAFGVASVKKSGQAASGDTHSVIKIDERRFMVALSDGMGSGEYARRISESTISLLESFYRAKMPSPLVLSTINKLLTFSKEETFACVDIAIVDLDDGRADVVKIGSPLGFILSGSAVKVLENHSLPLGVLESLRPTTAVYQLLENDVLLFLSDGVTDAFGSTSDLYEVLKRVPAHNPQQLADELISRALQAYGGVAKDDMTVVAVRLFKGVQAA
ncbi:MAG: SpoIIE family protein phosphatase [Clostridia bacterium]|nr:SpoIIE family protein phosphatase [Clostridia bacterium]